MPPNAATPGPLSALLSLEVPFGTTFDAPAVEWRRLASEFLGTLLLVLVAAGAVVVNSVSGGRVSLASQVVAPGILVMALIYTVGSVGGAHLNPAVTLCFAVRGNFPWIRVPGYIATQFAGAIAAAALLRGLFGDVAALGATFPAPGISNAQAMVVEGLLTFTLCTVILGTASGAKNVGTNAAIAVGGYVAAAGLWAAPITGASMNPARSFGPALISGDLQSWWIYFVGPIGGALLGVGAAWILRGRPTRAGSLAAQGDLDDRRATH